MLEPDEGKLSSPVLRGPGASNGTRLLHSNPLDRIGPDKQCQLNRSMLSVDGPSRNSAGTRRGEPEFAKRFIRGFDNSAAPRAGLQVTACDK